MNRLKICMIMPRIVTSTAGSIVGGGANIMIQICKGLTAHGHDVTVVAGSTPKVFPILKNMRFSWAQIYPIKVNCSSPSVKYGLEFLFKVVPVVIKIHQQRVFDIIHCHFGYSPYGLISALLRGILDVASIGSLYSPLVRHIDGVQKSLLLHERVNKYCLGHYEKLIVLSNNTKHSVMELGIPPQKIEVIPPSVDSSFFKQNNSHSLFRNNYGISHHTKLVLFVGNFSLTKGIDLLLEAVANILPYDTSVKLVLALDPSHRNFSFELQSLKKKIVLLGISQNIIILDIVSDMRDVMVSSDVIVAPFRSTAGITDYPMPILEAMAIGRAVIASSVGGIPEVIEHGKTGYLVPPGNVDALRSAITKLLEDMDLRNRIATAASTHASQKFSNNTPIVEKVYYSVREEHKLKRAY